MNKECNTLNKAVQSLAIHLALERTDNARSHGIADLKVGDQPGWLTDLEGIGGEIAACKLFQAYPDTIITIPLQPYDFISKTGKTVDVKTTKHETGRLTATLKKKVEDCDMYVLMIGEFPRYRYAGSASATDLIDEKNIGEMGKKGRAYILTQEQLRRHT